MLIIIKCECGEETEIELSFEKHNGISSSNNENIEVRTDYDPRLIIHCRKCGSIESI